MPTTTHTAASLSARAQTLSTQRATLNAEYARVLAARAALRILEQHPTATAIQVDRATFIGRDAGVVVTRVAAGEQILASFTRGGADLVHRDVQEDLTRAVDLAPSQFPPGPDCWVVLQGLLDRVPTA